MLDKILLAFRFGIYAGLLCGFAAGAVDDEE
jgi:hypothetical protein